MAAKAVGRGVIGARGWSDMIMGPAVNAARGAHLKAVLSSTEENAARYCASHGAARGYTGLKTFLADDAIDVVWITSPNHLHKAQAVAALKAGKHVLCEKPMAMSQAECRAMIRAALKAGRLLSVGHNSRHHPRLRILREQWRAGRFGAPVQMHGQFHFRYPQVPDDWWRLDDETSGWLDPGRRRHPLHRPPALVQRRGQDRARPPLQQGLRALRRPHLTLHRLRERRCRHHLDLGRGHRRRRHRAARQRRLLQGRGRLRRDSRLHHHGAQGGKPRTAPLAGFDTYKAQVENVSRAVARGAALAVSAQDDLANVRVIEQARGW